MTPTTAASVPVVHALATPILYPTACFITGTTPNGGGLWKYVLRLHEHGLLRRNRPVMTQVLHFLDFGVSPNKLNNFWRLKSLRRHYNGHFDLDYQGVIFADSGGFTLMFDPDLDLSGYGIAKNALPEGILKLQLDLGADYVVSLDYPIPPNLDPAEAKRRQALTKDSALRTARLLAEQEVTSNDSQPKLFLPLHGLTPESLSAFTNGLLEALDVEGLMTVVAGFGLGSMVPRRKNGATEDVLAFTRAAVASLPAGTPLHVFGMTGSLVPLLLHEGATSFDTSGYIQHGRALHYIDPETRRSLAFRHLPDYPCECPVCSGRDIEEDKAILDGRSATREKSEVYAAIALHNLEMDYRLLAESTLAAQQGRLAELLVELTRRYPTLKWPEWLKDGQETKDTKGSITHSATHSIQSLASSSEPESGPSKIRRHTAEDFDLRRRRWQPDHTKDILLILPCSQEKPYTESRSYQSLNRFLTRQFGGNWSARVQLVFLSGLYGPVPEKYVHEDALTTYDFRLHRRDIRGIARISERLGAFIDRHHNVFTTMTAYVTQPPYRQAVRQVCHIYPDLKLLPERGRLGLSSFTKSDCLRTLADAIHSAHRVPVPVGSNSTMASNRVHG